MSEQDIIRRYKYTRPTASDQDHIETTVWIKRDSKPVAAVQIAHGMAERVSRYNEFAVYLANTGFAVFMNEHAGHGEEAETLGYFSKKDGMGALVEDMKSLTDGIKSEFPDIPIFLLGHSMGSFLSRRYITKYADDLAGCILSGTSGTNPLAAVGRAIAGIQCKLKGPKSPGKLLSYMSFGAYTKKIDNPVNACAWLSRDDDICIKYQDDPLCGFYFTAQGYHDMLSLLKEITSKKWASKVPTRLPIYLMSGEEDPVGAYGKGVVQTYERLKAAGIEDLSLKLYPGGRHEMLNELNKEEVYADILTWLEARVGDLG